MPAGRLGAGEHVGELVRKQRQSSLVEREIERAADSLVERRDDCERRPDAGADVDQRGADAHRRPIRLAGHAHDPRRRLHQRVVAGLRCERPAPAERADRAVDELRIALAQLLRPDSEPLGRSGTQALNGDVRTLGQPQQRLAPAGILEIEGQRALAGVGGEEHDAAPLEEPRAPVTRLVAAPGMLDLDDVGAECRQDLGRRWAGERARQVEHAHALQR